MDGRLWLAVVVALCSRPAVGLDAIGAELASLDPTAGFAKELQEQLRLSASLGVSPSPVIRPGSDKEAAYRSRLAKAAARYADEVEEEPDQSVEGAQGKETERPSLMAAKQSDRPNSGGKADSKPKQGSTPPPPSLKPPPPKPPPPKSPPRRNAPASTPGSAKPPATTKSPPAAPSAMDVSVDAVQALKQPTEVVQTDWVGDGSLPSDLGETSGNQTTAPAPPKPKPKAMPVHNFTVKDLETFMYYHRMVSFYMLPSGSYERKYLKVDKEEKLLVGGIEQDVGRKYASFKLHRALAYTGNELFGFKPWCFSFTPAFDPSRYLVSVRDTFLTLRKVREDSPKALKEAASFCVLDKKDGNSRKDTISLTTFNNDKMVWRTVDKFMSMGEYVKYRRKSFTPASATIVVQPALFHGECHKGVKKKCTCAPGYVGVNCHSLDCVLQKQQKKGQCSYHGICQEKEKKCACNSKYFGYDCQYTKCPKWGPIQAERTCNHRGYCNIANGNCICDKGWTGKACQKGTCENNCNNHGKCDTATGICTCNKYYWGKACEKKKCEHFFPACSKKGTCTTAGPDEGKCVCKGRGYGNACQFVHCPKKDCSKNGYCNKDTGVCKCFTHYFGPDCANKNCPNGCGGNGLCSWRTGICKCNHGWGLADCSERVCPKNCSGRGRCNKGTGKCECLGHSYGDACQHVCKDKCNQRGRCNQSTGKCECAGKYFGDACDKAKCKNNCSGRGKCDLNTGKCLCSKGFTNADCAVKRCSDDCNNQGKCVGDASISKCECTYPYFGATCRLKKCPRNCANNGVCDYKTGTCRCMKGFAGSDCMQKTCLKDCNNRGECHFGKCQCLKPFKGAACEFADCSVDCGEHGSCDNTEGKCKCQGLWTGQKCNVRKCPNDCSGHGQCSKAGVCVCLPKWYSEDCSKHKCHQNCNNGMCDPKTGKCKCQPGFFTKDCSKKSCSGKNVKCDDKKCKCGLVGAKANCDYTTGQCKCLPNLSRAEYFFSIHCEKRKCPGPCDEEKATCSCSGHGTCNYQTGKCRCANGYEGNSCAFLPARDAFEMRSNMNFNLKSSSLPNQR